MLFFVSGHLQNERERPDMERKYVNTSFELVVQTTAWPH